MNAIALMGKFLGLNGARRGDAAAAPARLSGWDRTVSLLESRTVVKPEHNPVEAALRKALVTDLFFLDYQPIYDLAGKVIEVEALLRSHEPLLQKIGPAEYIRVAEECNLMVTLGERVLLLACTALAEWRSLGLSGVTVAVNVSCLQLINPGFAEFVLQLLDQHRIPPTAIHMEITETIRMPDTSAMLAQMTILSDAGVCFSIDDFGTGFSTLQRLSRLPICTMKIDQSFVQELPGNGRVDGIMRGMIDLARHLGMEVIAEGVETQQQFDLLVAAGCQQFQGYLFNRPMSEPRMRELLIANYSLLVPQERLTRIAG